MRAWEQYIDRLRDVLGLGEMPAEPSTTIPKSLARRARMRRTDPVYLRGNEGSPSDLTILGQEPQRPHPA